MADLGDGVELSVIKVDGAAGGSENGSSGVMGSPVRMRDRPEADLVAGDASALTPTHTNPDARQGAGKHKPKVTAGIPSAVFNFLNSIVGGASGVGARYSLRLRVWGRCPCSHNQLLRVCSWHHWPAVRTQGSRRVFRPGVAGRDGVCHVLHGVSSH